MRISRKSSSGSRIILETILIRAKYSIVLGQQCPVDLPMVTFDQFCQHDSMLAAQH